MQVLERIVAAKREAVSERKRIRPLERFRGALRPARRSLRRSIRSSGCGFVLECKRAAPSAGLLRPDYDPAAIARE